MPDLPSPVLSTVYQQRTRGFLPGYLTRRVSTTSPLRSWSTAALASGVLRLSSHQFLGSGSVPVSATLGPVLRGVTRPTRPGPYVSGSVTSSHFYYRLSGPGSQALGQDFSTFSGKSGRDDRVSFLSCFTRPRPGRIYEGRPLTRVSFAWSRSSSWTGWGLVPDNAPRRSRQCTDGAAGCDVGLDPASTAFGNLLERTRELGGAAAPGSPRPILLPPTSVCGGQQPHSLLAHQQLLLAGQGGESSVLKTEQSVAPCDRPVVGVDARSTAYHQGAAGTAALAQLKREPTGGAFSTAAGATGEGGSHHCWCEATGDYLCLLDVSLLS